MTTKADPRKEKPREQPSPQMQQGDTPGPAQQGGSTVKYTDWASI